jgi:hydrogenase maturation protein HypF
VSLERVVLRLLCRGVVQGVGFRPRVYRLATGLGLAGRLVNLSGGVLVELRGPRAQLERFLEHLPAALPAGALLEPLQPEWAAEPVIEPVIETAGRGVVIVAADPEPLGIGLLAPVLVADRAPCPACLAELADPAARRHGYPFLSCTACGPRFSIATAEPWARAHTTLAGFPLCEACAAEFDDPADRRFHAETIACPRCGPQLRWLEPAGGGPEGEPPADLEAALGGDLIARACALLAAGRILALQGVGGFQLLVDAGNAAAVAELRRRKRRPAKPLALLVAEEGGLRPWLAIDAAEAAMLRHAAAPIVLLRRRRGAFGGLPGVVEAVAPGSAALGVMRPASPLHELLARRFGRPLVATSGNCSGEPLCTDPAEALQRLGGGAGAGPAIADAFLVHDRPIARPLDDSVLQLIEGRPALLRRARGFAPEALAVGLSADDRGAAGVLALGGDLKSAPALALGDRCWLAPHLGDLGDPGVQQRLRAGVHELSARYGAQLAAIACDAHPGYGSHQLANAFWPQERQPGGPRPVQHHLAHTLAVMAEHGLEAPLLAAVCDGLGYAEPAAAAPGQHQLLGGELLAILPESGGRWRAEHLAGLRPFPLPGGERAMREPRRAALGLVEAAALGDHPGAWRLRQAFTEAELALLQPAIARGCNAPLISSAGRLFDAAAALLGLVDRASYEGEGGERLQGAAARAMAEGLVPDSWAGEAAADATPLPLRGGALDWEPLLLALLEDIAAGQPPLRCAWRFHRGLADGLAAALAALAPGLGVRRVALAGGCFQNRLLLEGCIAALRRRGLEPFWSEALPAGDGGLALGQLLAVRRDVSLLRGDGAAPSDRSIRKEESTPLRR